jgi:molybdopterin-binding protein
MASRAHAYATRVAPGPSRPPEVNDLASDARLKQARKPKEEPLQISARNKLPGEVTKVTEGEAIANVELDVGGMRLVASVTVEAVRELGIAPGTAVTALVKASDVMLAVE